MNKNNRMSVRIFVVLGKLCVRILVEVQNGNGGCVDGSV